MIEERELAIKFGRWIADAIGNNYIIGTEGYYYHILDAGQTDSFTTEELFNKFCEDEKARPKERERVGVTIRQLRHNTLELDFNERIPEEKYPAIKSAVEKILNERDDPPGNYTQKDMENCWYASRCFRLGANAQYKFKDYLEARKK